MNVELGRLRGVGRASREVAILAVMFLAYKAVRLAVAGRVDAAFENARHVIDFERAVHLGVEQAVQRLVLHWEGLVVALNRYYVSMHFTTFVVFLVWIFFAHRDHYAHLRRLIVASTALALALHAVYPLAPPRMLPGFIDTMARFGPNAYASAAVASVANQHAAMPSVHFMWALIVAYGVVRAARSPLRWVAIAHPVLTLFAIVATANHFVLDAVIGGGLVVVVLTFDVAISQVFARQTMTAPAPAPASG
jgi:hypothetical protein